MQATTLQEIVDSACEWIDERMSVPALPGSAILDGTMYSPSSRAIPGLEEVWRDGDAEAWEYVDGKVDDHITERGLVWDEGMLRLPDGDATAASPECICHRLGDTVAVNCPVHGRVERTHDFHICTCGDCDSEAFADRCRFEVALRALVDDATEFHSAHVVDSALIATSKSLLGMTD